MKKGRERPPDNKEQSERFVDAARQLESDESGEAFKRAFGSVAPPKNKKDETKRKPIGRLTRKRVKE